MTMFELGAWSFPVLLLLIFLRMPIGLAMFLAGVGGLWMATGDTSMFMARLKTETFTTFSSYSLSIVPMFLLMGQFATLSGMSTALFKAAESWLGHRKGGVAMASVGACAGFGAICGSSLATAATMGREKDERLASMTLFADRVMDRTLLGFELTASQFGAMNSFFIPYYYYTCMFRIYLFLKS